MPRGRASGLSSALAPRVIHKNQIRKVQPVTKSETFAKRRLTMRRVGYWVTSSLTLVLVLLSGERINAQPGANSFVPFNEFMARTAAQSFSASTAAGSKVADAAAFEEMRRHILKMYEGAQVTHSFVMGRRPTTVCRSSSNPRSDFKV